MPQITSDGQNAPGELAKILAEYDAGPRNLG
jgi:hypothetical protein